MIHYILLPKEERHALRREYRLRLAIITFFFISCAVAIGIASLFPAYFYSREQVLEAKVREEVLERSRRESGAAEIEKQLLTSQAIADKINAEKAPVVSEEVVQKIISHKRKDLFINSFTLVAQPSTTTLASVTLAGRAGTRDALLEFKKALEGDKYFHDIELPLSDIAKNKNITYELRLKIRKQ
jgi:hypothetical protein